MSEKKCKTLLHEVTDAICIGTSTNIIFIKQVLYEYAN